MATVSLIILTLTLGGLLMQFNIIQTAMVPLAKRLKSSGSLVTALSFRDWREHLRWGTIPLRDLTREGFKQTFNDRGLDNLALSRVLEDGRTVINYLIP